MYMQITPLQFKRSVTDPGLDQRQGWVVISLALLAFLPTVISSFFPNIRGWGWPPGFSPRSATRDNH